MKSVVVVWSMYYYRKAENSTTNRMICVKLFNKSIPVVIVIVNSVEPNLFKVSFDPFINRPSKLN